MQSSPTILFAVICGFFAIILMMVAFAVYFIRKENAKKEKMAKALGFTLVTDTAPLLERVARVNGITRPELYRVEGVYQRHTSGGDVYMFGFHRRDIKNRTLNNKNGSSKIHYHPLETDVLAFISPAWNLPHFTAVPRISGGKLGTIANNIIESMADIKMEAVKFQHIPNLDERYLIVTSEYPAKQANLPDAFLRTLASNPNLKLHTGGDTLTISHANSVTQPPDEESMKRLYKIGAQLARDIQEKH